MDDLKYTLETISCATENSDSILYGDSVNVMNMNPIEEACPKFIEVEIEINRAAQFNE